MINIPQLIKVSVKTWFEISVTPSCFFKVSRWRWVPHLLNFLSYRILLSALFISFPFDVFTYVFSPHRFCKLMMPVRANRKINSFRLGLRMTLQVTVCTQVRKDKKEKKEKG